MPVITQCEISDLEAAACASTWADEPKSGETLRIALINNMPDAALEDTESQFRALLHRASGDVPVCLRLFALPGVPRADRGLDRIHRLYSGLDELWKWRCDAAIMTGAEPRHANLREESYWSPLAAVLDWAERHTISIVLSCLAAHASVLHGDGIERNPLREKRCGVFPVEKTREHELTRGARAPMRFPHSRWNEVRKQDLAGCGYAVLTESAQAGVDSFIKKRGRCLFVHFQGHPEYDALTLFKEYRRDVRRFLHRERESYPAMPEGYFSATAAKRLFDFQERALNDPSADLMAAFPEVEQGLEKTWLDAALRLYGNWLRMVAAGKRRAPRATAVARDLRALEKQPVGASGRHAIY